MVTMQLPLNLPSELEKYQDIQSEEILLEKLKATPIDAIQFFQFVAENETWCEQHPNFIKNLLQWFTKSNLEGNYPRDFFKSLVPTIHKYISFLKPFIPADLTIEINKQQGTVNNLLLGQQSQYFQRRLFNECREQEKPFLKLDLIAFDLLDVIDEFITTGEVHGLWKLPQDKLWTMIESLKLVGMDSLIDACQMVLKRYIDRRNAFDILLKAHQNFLKILQDAAIEFINQLDLGIRLLITSVEHLSLEFVNFREPAKEAFEKLSLWITHLTFSQDLPTEQSFLSVINKSPKLFALDLSDANEPSEHFEELPDRIRELSLSRCTWISNSILDTLSRACPKITKLDLSSNDRLTYSIWGSIQKFKNLKILDVSRCYQISDTELKIILEAAPKLIELSLVDCQGISPNSFFDLSKKLSELTNLNVSKTLITDAGLIDVLTNSKNLMYADFSRCQSIGDRGVIEGIRNSPQLKSINLINSRISKACIEQIKIIKPYLIVIF